MSLVVYIDLYFFINVTMDFIILHTVSKVLKLKLTRFGLLKGSLVGGLGASVLVLYPMLQQGFLSLIMNFLISLCMVRISCGRKKLHNQWNVVFTLYVITFMIGGMLSFIFYNTNVLSYVNQVFNGGKSNTVSIYILLLAMGIIVVTFPTVVTYINTFRGRITNIFEVSLFLEGKHVDTKGLMDTGNHVREPISGKPAIIVEKELMDCLLTKELLEYTTRVKVIPYRSIGKENGTMYAIVLDEIIVTVNEERHHHNNVVACVYDGVLSAKKDYRLILHEELL